RRPREARWAIDWNRLRLAAALGDYDQADSALADALADFDRGSAVRQMDVRLRVLHQVRLALTVRGDPPHVTAPLSLLTRVPWEFCVVQERAARLQLNARCAQLEVMRGWLDLESGRLGKARANLRAALERGAPTAFALTPLSLALGPGALQFGATLNSLEG